MEASASGVVGGARGSGRCGLAGVDLRGRSVGLGLLPEGNFCFLLCNDSGGDDVGLPLEFNCGLELGKVLGLGGVPRLFCGGCPLSLGYLYRLYFGGHPLGLGSGLELG